MDALYIRSVVFDEIEDALLFTDEISSLDPEFSIVVEESACVDVCDRAFPPITKLFPIS